MTVAEFAQKVQNAEQESLKRHNLGCEANLNDAITHIHTGKKWVRVDSGSSGHYMINPQGQIYGIKAYGVPHLGHYYGTLENPNPVCFQGRWDRR